MTVSDLAKNAGYDTVCMPSPDREIDGVYVGDLLSWVMGRAQSDNVWITIMSNVNIVAVASLTDVSCILLAEGVIPEGDVLSVAQAKGINLLSTPLPAYEASLKTASLI